jgi:hypothetical protein
VPHTLASNDSAPTSTLWSPIPWRFGDAVAIFVSATRGPPNFVSVMLWMDDDLKAVVAQADLTAGDAFELGRRPGSRFISYQPFDRLDGGFGAALKDEVYSELNRSTPVPNRIVLISNLSSNVIDQQFTYFDRLTIAGCLLMVEAHTIFPEPSTAGYRVFYSVFGCQKLTSECLCTKNSNPAAPSTRMVWCDRDFARCDNDTAVVSDGHTLGLVTKIDPALLGVPALKMDDSRRTSSSARYHSRTSPPRPWFDPSLPTAARARALVNALATAEKPAQMLSDHPGGAAIPRLGVPCTIAAHLGHSGPRPALIYIGIGNCCG